MSDALLTRLEAVVNRLEKHAKKVGAPGAAADDEEEVAEQILAWGEYMKTHVQPFLDVCAKYDEMKKIGTDMEKALTQTGVVIAASVDCKKPAQNDMMKFLGPIVEVISGSQNPKRGKGFDMEKSFGECIQCLNWLLMPNTYKFITGQKEAADFYMIKIQKVARDMEEPGKSDYRAFVANLKKLMDEMSNYTKEFYKTGLVWNAKGGSINDWKPNAKKAAAPAAGGAPPPPGPPPASTGPPKKTGGSGGLGAVFGELTSKGHSGVTATLKKVTKDMKAKNNKDKPVLKPKAKAPAKKFTKKEEVVKEPKLYLNKGTWFSENANSSNGITEIPDVQLKENVYILKPRDCIVRIPNKCKSIQIDGAHKATIVFSSVVSLCEVFNSSRVKIICEKFAPSFAIDKTSGVSIFLSEENKANPPDIICSSISEVNIVVPGATPEADPIEMALPEQYISKYDPATGKITTEPVVHGD